MDTMDFWAGTVLIFVLALVQSIIYGWVMGIEKGHKELHQGAHIKVPFAVQFVLKYVTPTFLIIIGSMFLYSNSGKKIAAIQTDPVVRMSVMFIGGVFFFLLLLVHIAGIRWQKEGKFDVFYEDDDE